MLNQCEYISFTSLSTGPFPQIAAQIITKNALLSYADKSDLVLVIWMELASKKNHTWKKKNKLLISWVFKARIFCQSLSQFRLVYQFIFAFAQIYKFWYRSLANDYLIVLWVQYCLGHLFEILMHSQKLSFVSQNKLVLYQSVFLRIIAQLQLD